MRALCLAGNNAVKAASFGLSNRKELKSLTSVLFGYLARMNKSLSGLVTSALTSRYANEIYYI